MYIVHALIRFHGSLPESLNYSTVAMYNGQKKTSNKLQTCVGSLQRVKQCKVPYLYFTVDSHSRFRGLELKHWLTATMHNVSRSSPRSAQEPRGQGRHTIWLDLTVHLQSQRCVTLDKHPMNDFYEWHIYYNRITSTDLISTGWGDKAKVCVCVWGGGVAIGYVLGICKRSITWDGCYELAAWRATMPSRT